MIDYVVNLLTQLSRVDLVTKSSKLLLLFPSLGCFCSFHTQKRSALLLCLFMIPYCSLFVKPFNKNIKGFVL